MIEFTWTQTVAESQLWARELGGFSRPGRTVGDLAAIRPALEARRLPTGVVPEGTTDLDLLDEVLRSRSPEMVFTDVLGEPRAEVEERCALLELTEAGQVVDWDRDQPIVALPAHVVRGGLTLDTVGFTADCLDTAQQEWDVLRDGWPARLADRGWQPCSTAFLTAAMTGFLDVYQRQSAPRMHDVVLVEPLSPHPLVRRALEELRPARR